jgi:hypothetical protein
MASAAEEARFAYRQLRERERIVRQAAAVRLQAAARGLLARQLREYRQQSRQLREYRQQLRDRDRINARLGEAARSGGCGAPPGCSAQLSRASATAGDAPTSVYPTPRPAEGSGITAGGGLTPGGCARPPHAATGKDSGAASAGGGAGPPRSAPAVAGLAGRGSCRHPGRGGGGVD